MEHRKSLFTNESDIIPPTLTRTMNIADLVGLLGEISFEARNVHRGALLYKKMISSNDTIWLGIAGAGIAGGMGGMVISLIEAGFIDVICSTGAQVYHDLHFAYDLPVKAISPSEDKLVQIWGEYSVIFPILAAYVMNQCETRSQKNIISKIKEFVNRLESAL